MSSWLPLLKLKGLLVPCQTAAELLSSKWSWSDKIDFTDEITSTPLDTEDRDGSATSSNYRWLRRTWRRPWWGLRKTRTETNGIVFWRKMTNRQLCQKMTNDPRGWKELDNQMDKWTLRTQADDGLIAVRTDRIGLGQLSSCKLRLRLSLIGWPQWSGKHTYQNEKSWRQLWHTRTYAAEDDSGSCKAMRMTWQHWKRGPQTMDSGNRRRLWYVRL